MERNQRMPQRTGLLALAGAIAFGGSFASAQVLPRVEVQNPVPNVEGSVQVPTPAVPSVRTPAVRAPAVRTPAVRTPGVQAPAVRTPAAPRAGATVQVPGAGVQTNVNANARRAGLGFKLDGQGNQGLRITGLEGTSAAARAGFRANDRIVSVDGRAFATQVQLRGYLATQGGRRVPVIIEREGQQYTIELPLDQRPTEGAWLGVNLDEGESSGANIRGARIARVFPSGPAAQAGLQTGDVITNINNQPVSGSSDVIILVQEMQPSTQVEVSILRDNTEMKIPVVLGDRSGYMGQFQPQSNSNQSSNGLANRPSDGDDIPAYAMQLESERRMAEQHERIEDEIRQLRDEIKKLRELLEKK